MNLNIFDFSQNSPPAENCYVIDTNENSPGIAHPQIWDRDPREHSKVQSNAKAVDINGSSKEFDSYPHCPPILDPGDPSTVQVEPYPSLTSTLVPPPLHGPPTFELHPLPAV